MSTQHARASEAKRIIVEHPFVIPPESLETMWTESDAALRVRIVSSSPKAVGTDPVHRSIAACRTENGTLYFNPLYVDGNHSDWLRTAMAHELGILSDMTVWTISLARARPDNHVSAGRSSLRSILAWDQHATRRL